MDMVREYSSTLSARRAFRFERARSSAGRAVPRSSSTIRPAIRSRYFSLAVDSTLLAKHFS